MWLKLAQFILKYRIILLILISVLTLFMGYMGKNAQIAYSSSKIIPDDHPQNLVNEKFKKQFGQGGNILFIGVQSEQFFQLDFFKDWYQLGNDLKKVEGVATTISLAHIPNLVKDTLNKKFAVSPFFEKVPSTQADLDTLKKQLLGMPFYEEILFNPQKNIYTMGVGIPNEILDSEQRFVVHKNILDLCEPFEKKHNVDLKVTGLPHIRAVMAQEVNAEMGRFLLYSFILSALLLLLLFRSFSSMFFPMLIVAGGVAWTLGTVVLLGYEITMLIGLIPPLIVVISVPNCVYLINHYHQQIRKHGNKAQALEQIIRRIGYVIFYANLTTAIGFSVFALLRSEALQQFGIVAGLNIAILFITSIIFIPVILSFLPVPKVGQTKHLDSTFFNGILAKLGNWVFKYPKQIQIAMGVIFLIAVFGIMRLDTKSYVFDDVPHDTQEYRDLKFFEQGFNGVIPFDIMIDTKKKNGATKMSTLKKIEKVQKILAQDSIFSKPLSLVEGLKYVKQAYYGGLPKFYELPGQFDKTFILAYLGKSGDEKGSNELMKTFTDSTKQVIRITAQMADVGTHQVPLILNRLKTQVEKVLNPKKFDITYTGSSVTAFEANQFLINGLIRSVLLAFFLISCVVAFLFRSPKMLFVALIPNVIPLSITAALMGYTGIFLKPATVLIFSVALGISIDFTIHFLAKYQQERQKGESNTNALQTTLQETGRGMIYTATILFFGFGIFIISNFQGTFYLGILTSTTIIMAILANLILLPAILLTINKDKVEV